MRRALRHALLTLLVAGASAGAQERAVPVRVVEIAGANLYVNVGAAAGLSAGDTLAVRRAAAAAPVGALVVVAVSAERSVLTFAGRPFPVTRGDELLLSTNGAAPVAAVSPARGSEPRRPGAASRAPVQVRGSATLEVFGSTTTTLGPGADPARLSSSFAIPSARLQTSAWNLPGGGRLGLNVRVSQQSGPATLFDRKQVVRVYDAHYDQPVSVFRLLVGRFFSPYESFSGSWDGAMLRAGGMQGFGLGVAAGFMPSRGDETFSADVPKYAAFAGFRSRGRAVRWDTDVSAHAWRPRQGAAERTFLGWSQRLGILGVRLDHRVEVDRSDSGTWDLTRLDARVGVPLGSALEVSAGYFRDRLSWTDVPLDTLTAAFDTLISPRERFTAGAGVQVADMYLSADLTLRLSGAHISGHTYSGSLRLPEVAGTAVGGVVSYWTGETGGTGLLAMPSLDVRLGGVRGRLGYEYFQFSLNGVASVTHGVDLNVTLPWARRLESVFGVNLRYGQNLRSESGYSSLRLVF
jgi:hypothetical protein